MALGSTSSIARQIEATFDGASVAGLTDVQLLERFLASNDAVAEAAFSPNISYAC
jgi:hypothetical protein